MPKNEKTYTNTLTFKKKIKKCRKQQRSCVPAARGPWTANGVHVAKQCRWNPCCNIKGVRVTR